MIIKNKPLECNPGQFTDKKNVAGWERMTNRQAVSFRRHTGRKLSPDSQLVRSGNHIFEVGDADLAECVYNHTFTFD